MNYEEQKTIEKNNYFFSFKSFVIFFLYNMHCMRKFFFSENLIYDQTASIDVLYWDKQLDKEEYLFCLENEFMKDIKK